jgi:serine kinase of HPr protein (carbohydrate metabolism regulator)
VPAATCELDLLIKRKEINNEKNIFPIINNSFLLVRHLTNHSLANSKITASSIQQSKLHLPPYIKTINKYAVAFISGKDESFFLRQCKHHIFPWH